MWPLMADIFGQGRYRVIAPLGAGAFSEVYEVEDTRLGVRRALKVLRPEVVGDPAVRARFEAEARTMAMLSHPHLVTVMDVGEDRTPDGAVLAWLVMELLTGGTVEDAIQWSGAVDPVRAVRSMLGVIDGVALAHRSGVIHRDIKPANLLRDADGGLKLGDFGIAQLRSLDDLTRTGVALGSWAFMAPEQRLDPRSVGPASDVYGLAATLMWMIRGVPVSDLHVAEHRARLLVGVPDAIAGALSRALAFRPEERFHKVEAFGEVLALAVLDAPVVASGFLGGAEAALAPRDAPPSFVATPRLADRWAALRGWAVFGFAGVTSLAAVTAATVLVARTTPSGAAAPSGSAAPDGSELPWCDVSARSFAGPTAPGPRETLAATTADLDGDGVMDAIFMNQLDESVTVWWGPFARDARQDIPVGRSGVAPVVHDVDGDGHLDLVAPLSDDAAFAVVRGLGGRRFSEANRVMQGPGPRNTSIVVVQDGATALFLAGGQLLARPVTADLRWPPHRTLLNVPLLVQGAVAVDGDAIWVALYGTAQSLIRLDRNLTVREQHVVDWPTLTGAFAADLALPVGDELYGQLADGRVIRLPRSAGEVACAATPPGAMLSSGVLAQLDGDGIPDIVMADSCAECTSSQMVRFGTMASMVGGL